MSRDSLDALADRSGLPALLAALGAGEARFVGGVVRDVLLGVAANDIDLATVLSPYEVMRRLGAAGIKTVPTGIAHGTVTAISEGRPVEITTLRTDVDTDGRRASVAFTDDWHSDAARRDFTVNAMYWDPAGKALFDPFGGEADLAAGHIRFIGDPLVRIAEDHLRILRFFRFTARFAKGGPDPDGLAACMARANDLMALSRERIAWELINLLSLPVPSATVALMIDHGILLPVLPEIERAAVPRLDALIVAERMAEIVPDAIRRLAALLPADVAMAEKVAARLKLSKRQRKQLALAAHRDLDERPTALAYRIGVGSAQDRLLLANRPADAAALTGWVAPHLPIGGGALIKRGIVPGPGVARTLRAIEDRWVSEDFLAGARFEVLVDEALVAAGGRSPRT